MTLPNRRIEALEQSYGELLALCDALEAVADSLPHTINARTCTKLSDAAEPVIARVHRVEEEALFPLLATSQKPQLSRTLARLREEHLTDHSVAAEVSEALHGLGTGQSKLSADAVGYLLRSFFESMRRHVQGVHELIAMVPPVRNGDKL